MEENDAAVVDVRPVERRANRFRGAETNRAAEQAPSMCVMAMCLRR